MQGMKDSVDPGSLLGGEDVEALAFFTPLVR